MRGRGSGTPGAAGAAAICALTTPAPGPQSVASANSTTAANLVVRIMSTSSVTADAARRQMT
jgi:hypothetical protein